MIDKVRSLRTHIQNLGVWGAIVYNFFHLFGKLIRNNQCYRLISKYSNFPLLCRPNSSDVNVFYQIFVIREYACLDDIENPHLIIDCGANAGFSSAYFLSKYPATKLIAIEPDIENFKILEKNLIPYGDRVKLINAAIWSHNTNLTYDSSSLGKKQEWSRRLHETKSGESVNIHAIDLNSVLMDSRNDSISILKIDIEGAEKAVFSTNYESWLSCVNNLAIELHGPGAKTIFKMAVNENVFDFSESGELTICRRKVQAKD